MAMPTTGWGDVDDALDQWFFSEMGTRQKIGEGRPEHKGDQGD
jgi:hypothetical protein